MFGEVVGTVVAARLPNEIELVLFDAVAHPPVSHVKGFGQFLAQVCGEDAFGGGIVSGYADALGWLGVAEFIEGCDDLDGVLAVHEYAASFCFRGGGDDVLECLA